MAETLQNTKNPPLPAGVQIAKILKKGVANMDIALRDEVIKDHLYIPYEPPTEYNIKKVFDDTYLHGQFHYHMSNFGHQFLLRWDEKMILKNPTQYENIPHRDYVFAAVFVHYWGKALFGKVPDWVHLYKFDSPYYTFDMPKDVWEKVAPIEFKLHNYYSEVGGVWFV